MVEASGVLKSVGTIAKAPFLITRAWWKYLILGIILTITLFAGIGQVIRGEPPIIIVEQIGNVLFLSAFEINEQSKIIRENQAIPITNVVHTGFMSGVRNFFSKTWGFIKAYWNLLVPFLILVVWTMVFYRLLKIRNVSEVGINVMFSFIAIYLFIVFSTLTYFIINEGQETIVDVGKTLGLPFAAVYNFALAVPHLISPIYEQIEPLVPSAGDGTEIGTIVNGTSPLTAVIT